MSSIKYINRPGHPVPFNMNVPGAKAVGSDDYGKTIEDTPRPQGTMDRGNRTDVTGVDEAASAFRKSVPNRSAWPRYRAAGS